jgi:hypothetical protein
VYAYSASSTGIAFPAAQSGVAIWPQLHGGASGHHRPEPRRQDFIDSDQRVQQSDIYLRPHQGMTNLAESNECVFVFDISGGKPLETEVLQVPNPFDGLAFHPGGKEFYVTGASDNLHFYDSNGSSWAEAGTPVTLGHTAALVLGKISPGALGMAVTADGRRLVVANYENDSISVVDIAGRVVLGELDFAPGQRSRRRRISGASLVSGLQTAKDLSQSGGGN